MSTATRIRTARRTVRIASRRPSSPPAVAPSPSPTSALEPSPEPVGGPTVVDLVKSSEHLIRTIGAPETGREKHQPKDLLRMVAKFLLESGKGYPRAEVLEVLQCFTGCGQGAAGEALQVLLLHEVVTAVNEVIRVTW